jgi:hypothetical protein
MPLPSLARLRLDAELAHWASADRRPGLWWRDDDARAATPALERLLTAAAGLPLALAVIPDGDLAGLAAHLTRHPNVTVGQHGVDHLNRRPEGQPAGEYALDADPDHMAVTIQAGWRALTDHGLKPAFYTPPWNRLDAPLPGVLIDLGFTALSAWPGEAGEHQGLVRRDAEIDLLRWKGGPRFRGTGRLLGQLRAALERRRVFGSDEPVGLLTHHLVHDEASWRFLAWFIPYARDRFDWPPAAPVATADITARQAA